MADTDTISFHCPSCSCKLNVPAAMSGASGPCPNCSNTITAPEQKQKVQEVKVVAEHISSDQIRAAAQLIRGSTQARKQVEEPAPKPIPATQAAPQEIEPEIQYRQFQTTIASPELIRKDNHSARKFSLLNILLPTTFAAAALVLVAALLHAVGMINVFDVQPSLSQSSNKGPAKTPNDNPDPLATQSTPSTLNPNTKIESASPSESATSGVVDSESSPSSTEQSEMNPEPDSTVTLTTENASADHQASATVTTDSKSPSSPPTKKPKKKINPVMANIMEKGEFPELKLSPSAPAQIETELPETKPVPVRKAGYFAKRNLEEFLEAKTLNDRLPYIPEDQRSPARWQNSSLEKPFKPVKSILLLETSAGEEKNMIKHLYMVKFEDSTEAKERLNLIVLLEERTGKHPPLIKVDAFLKHYDKMLSKYASQPNNAYATFPCYAETQTSDFIEDLPQEIGSSMVRFVIKTHPYYPAKFDAYLDMNSPLMAHVGNGKDLPYTISKRCVLSFEWNTSNPEHPYIEVADIVKSSGW